MQPIREFMARHIDFAPVDPFLLDKLAIAAWQAGAISAARQLGLFDLKGWPAAADRVAEQLGCSRRGLDALVDALCSLGLCHREGEFISTTATASAFLERASEAYCADAFVNQNFLDDAGKAIADAVRSADAREQWTEREIDQAAQFQELRTSIRTWPYTARTAATMWEKFRKFVEVRPRARLLDVGCGSGARTFAFAQEFAKLEIVSIDRRPALETARIVATKMDVSAQVRFLQADACALPFAANSFDIVFVGSVLCLHDPDTVSTILGDARRILKSNGALVIFEPIQGSGRSALTNLQLLVRTRAGRCYAASELEGLASKERYHGLKWLDPNTLLARP